MRRAATAEQKGSERLAVIETKGTKTPAKKTSKAKRASRARKRTLVIVESPTKAKTIEKYLGRKFIVRASMGHLRDLPKSQFGIDVDHNFTPKYINIRGKGDLIKALKKDAKNAEKIYLASDPDREGEAIAWHLAHIFDVDPKSDCRIVFNEITKPAIQEAVQHPRAIGRCAAGAPHARSHRWLQAVAAPLAEGSERAFRRACTVCGSTPYLRTREGNRSLSFCRILDSQN